MQPFLINTGAIQGKPDILNIIKENELGLYAISVVHHQGSMKYPCYGWYNKPLEVNSSISDNLNAIWRHFIAHTMGFTEDTEGLPHIFHMACRAGMLVTTYYKNYISSDRAIKQEPFDFKVPTSTGSYLTPEEIFSLYKSSINKDEEYTIPKTISMIHPAIMNTLMRLIYVEIKPNDPFEPNLFDYLFRLILEYITRYALEYPDLEQYFKKYVNQEEASEKFHRITIKKESIGSEELGIRANPRSELFSEDQVKTLLDAVTINYEDLNKKIHPRDLTQSEVDTILSIEITEHITNTNSHQDDLNESNLT